MPSLPYLKYFWCPRFQKKPLAINHPLKIRLGVNEIFRVQSHTKCVKLRNQFDTLNVQVEWS